MTRSQRSATALALALSVSLVSCGNPPSAGSVENTSAAEVDETDKRMPEHKGPTASVSRHKVAAPAQTATYCEVAMDTILPAECQRLKDFVAHLQIGDSALRAPERLTVGETADVTFAVTTAAAGSATDLVPAASSDRHAGTVASTPVKVSRLMSARLEAGPGFAVTPVGEQERDLALSGQAFWKWSVTAKAPTDGGLDLIVSAVLPDAQGNPTTHQVRVLHRSVAVKVRWLDRISSTTGIVTALTVLVTALSALWLALRTFGRGKGSDAKPRTRPPSRPKR